MKRVIIVAIVLFSAYSATSQTVFEAVKASQTDIVGTARYMSVAGAFGALGGDVSAIKDNPAGLGIFRKSELTTTVDAQMQSANALWGDKKATDSKYSVGLNNLTLVLAGKTWRAESGYAGLVNSNFSFSYNKLKNFNRNIRVRNDEIGQSMTDYFSYFSQKVDPDTYLYNASSISNNQLNALYDDTSLSWLGVMSSYGRLIKPIYDGNVIQEWASILDPNEKVTPEYTLRETGGINEYSLGWSGNFSNRFYLGATVNLQSINYQSTSTYEEAFSGNGGMTLRSNLSTTGAGVNVNIGAIAVPVDFVRIGLSLHTPMFSTINQITSGGLDFVTDVEGDTRTSNYSVDYILQTPLQFNVSTAFIIDKKGFISAEYVYNNYKGMKFISVDDHPFDDENDHINEMLENARTIKIGGEYRLTDNFSLRAGFANTSNITNSSAAKKLVFTTVRTDPEYFTNNSTNYTTFGLGYRENSWYIDLAYVNRLVDEDYYAYNSNALNDAYQVTPANVKTSNNNVLVTFGIKF